MPPKKSTKKKSAKPPVKSTPLQTIKDKKKYEQFQTVLERAIEASDYVTAFKILAEARNFVIGDILSEQSYNLLESYYQKHLKIKLAELGFIDISEKIISTTFWAMISSGNIALKGPPGVGKSFFSKVVLPELWMQNGEKPHVITIQPDRNMDIASLVADRGIKKGDTIVEEGQIADAVNLANQGQRVILVLEEINQWPPKVLKDLNDFLEERRLERKLAGKHIKLECPKENLFIIANYNPEGYTLGEDDTGSVSSRFIFCDLPFPSKTDLQEIIKVNVSDREFIPTIIGDEIKRRPTKPFLRSMSDICYSIRSSIEAGELGPLAMPIGTRHIINFSRAILNNNKITDAIYKALVDPILEKYVREGPLTNVEPNEYDEYIRTIFKAVKQILGTIDPVNEKSLKSLEKGLNITITELFQFQGKKPYEVEIRKGTQSLVKKSPITKPKSTKIRTPSSPSDKKPKPEAVIQKIPTQTGVDSSLPATITPHERKLSPATEIQQEEPLTTSETGTSVSEELVPSTSFQTPKKEPVKKKHSKVKSPKERPPELKCLKCGSSMSLSVDSRGKRNLICDNPDCRNLLQVPPYGEIRLLSKKCQICSSLILQIKRRHGKIVHLCPVCWRTPSVNGPCESCYLYSKCMEQ